MGLAIDRFTLDESNFFSLGLYWEGGPPTDYADRVSASVTINYKVLMLKRITKEIADSDRYASSCRDHFERQTDRIVVQRTLGRAAQTRLPD